MKLTKYKKEHKYSYSLGVFPTLELLRNRSNYVIEVYASTNSSRNKGASNIRKICSGENIPFQINDIIFRKLTKKENIYSIGVFRKYESKLSENGNHLVLVNPSNFGNLGTIIRTAIGFDIRDLAIIEPSADIFSPQVIRSSMGSIFIINFEHFNTLDEYLVRYKKYVKYLFYSDGSCQLPDVKFKEPCSLIFGNESSGLEEKYRKSGFDIKIPQSKNVDSLNLSVSVGIGLYAAKTNPLK